MERDYITTLQFSGRATIPDEEYDKLGEVKTAGVAETNLEREIEEDSKVH